MKLSQEDKQFAFIRVRFQQPFNQSLGFLKQSQLEQFLRQHKSLLM
ncbi:Uncharacterised protein [Mycobacteroides abscessus subsp. abscessus]|nr:Uncharacterised protein [Mycobacteroides abscessus subsp. abscessus]